MTIVEAISVVLTATPTGLTSREIYGEIVERNLYEFPAENPPAVVNSMIRRHCVDLNFPTSSPKKHFKIVGYQGKRPKYALVESNVKKTDEVKNLNPHELLPEEVIQEAYKQHINFLRDSLKDAIMKNDPAFFEQLIVSSDTLVENPLIKIYLDQMLNQIQTAADKDHDDLPIIVKKVTPEPDNSFWANIIGRGFPTPRTNGTFRWCTDRLKIAPSGKYIQSIISEQNTEVVVLLGVRKAESAARRKRMEGRELLGHLLNRHETIKKAFVYPAISELTTSDVWDILGSNQRKTAWGGDNAQSKSEIM